MDGLDRPIFIVGTGRCGSTVLTKMLAEHPHLAFFTTVSNAFPNIFFLQKIALGVWNAPLLGPLLRQRVIAGEAWTFWDNHIAGFSKSYRDFKAADVSIEQKTRLSNSLPRILSSERCRLLVKYTGWTRIGFIKEVFPDAKILHIRRDPRAVVNSLLHTEFWSGRRGPYHLNWGPLNDAELAIWDHYDQSFIALAAIEYKKIIDEHQRSIQDLATEQQRDIIDIPYSRLCNDTASQLREILQFCCLAEDKRFFQRTEKYKITSQNEKWKRNLTSYQQKQLLQVMDELELTQYYDL